MEEAKREGKLTRRCRRGRSARTHCRRRPRRRHPPRPNLPNPSKHTQHKPPLSHIRAVIQNATCTSWGGSEIGLRPASISMPSSSSSLTVFESALWLRVRVSQPRPGGAPARQRRAPSSSFNYASAGGGIRGGTGSRHVAVGFRRRRWEPALLRGHSVFPPLSCWLSDCGDGSRRCSAALARRPVLGRKGRRCGSTGRGG